MYGFFLWTIAGLLPVAVSKRLSVSQHHTNTTPVETVDDFGTGEEACEDCFQGDVLSEPKEPGVFPGRVSGAEPSLLERGNSTYMAKKWPGGIVKYRWHSKMDPAAKEAVQEAIAEWEAKTCITFEEQVGAEADWSDVVKFQSHKNGCNANMGYGTRKGRKMNLGDGCRHKGLALHELGHVVGLDHEHQRGDAHEFIEIVKENIQPDKFKWFTPDPGHTAGIPFDLASIMFYGAYHFNNGKGPSIRVKKKDNWNNCQVGQRAFLSLGDVLTVNKMYECEDRFCADIDPACAAFTRKGYCPGGGHGSKKNIGWMERNCRQSCGLCKCEDKDADCKRLAGEGYCPRGGNGKSDNHVWMKDNCPLSCGRCSAADPHCKDNPRGAWDDPAPEFSCATWGHKSSTNATGNSRIYCGEDYFNQLCPETCGACPAKPFCFG